MDTTLATNPDGITDSPASTQSTATSNVSKVIGIKKDIPYHDRQAVRVIVSNSAGEIIILHASNGNYYKLPGGGLEPSESHAAACQREVLEETGCKISLYGECIAITEEWRGDLHQISYCYRARMVEDTGVVGLTEEEVGDALRHEWVEVGEAIEKMRACEPAEEFGRSVKERDLYLVEVYAKGV